MPNCIIPGCAKEGTRLHQVELPGSEHLLCDGHYDLLFVSGMAGEEDLRGYNAAYQAILDQRRAEAKAKVELMDTELHSGPCAACGKRIVVQKGVPFTLGVGMDGTRVCPECMEDANALLAAPDGEPAAKEAAGAVKDANRCAVCGWPLKDRPEDGCVRGNCSQRPLPDSYYDPERALLEAVDAANPAPLGPIEDAEEKEADDGQGPARVEIPHSEGSQEAGL